MKEPAWPHPWRDAAAVVAGTQALAVAVWLVPASVHIVSWPPASAPVRVALVAPALRLLYLALAGLGLAAGLIVARRTEAVRPLGRIGAALCLLWLWGVPYLPWIPESAPLLLVLAGPVRWILAALAVALALPPARWIERLREGWSPNRRFVFAASLALYVGFGLYNARVLGPGGDEPHYLIISQSLLADGDLQIENNHQRQEYRSFFSGTLRPDYMRRGINGQIYSIHAPGLPALLVPFYAVGGYFACVAVIAAMAALAALAIFDVAALLAGPRVAALTWVAVCLSVPFVPHSWMIFPEMPGTLAVAWAVLWLVAPSDPPPRTWVLRGMVLAALPWLHTKFVVLTMMFGAALLWRVRRSIARAIAFAAPIVIATAAWLYSFYVMYGTFDPQSPYGDYVKINVLTRNIPRGLLGLLVDQKFGLLFYSPIYLLAIAGAWILLRDRDRRWLTIVLLAVVGAFVGGTTRLYMWWGGSSAPARFLVPILPCLAPFIAAAAARATGALSRTLIAIWMTIGLAVAAIGVAWPERLFLLSEPHGWARLLETVQASSPLARSFPTFTNEDWRTPLLGLVPWTIAALIALAVMRAAASRRPLRPLWLAVAGSVIFLVAAGVATARPSADVREDTAARGVRNLWFAYDDTRLRGIEYDTLQRVSSPRLFELATLSSGPPAAGRRGDIVAGPFSLPAGVYDARVWFTSLGAPVGEAIVSSMQGAVFGRAAVTHGGSTVVPFSLPINVDRVVVRAAPDAIAAVQISARGIVPSGRRRDVHARAIEAVPHRPAAYIAYLDDGAYPENGVFWTRGSDTARLLVIPDVASRVTLTLFAGPKGSQVSVIVAGQERDVDIKPGAATTMSWDLPTDLRLIPVTVRAASWFRPSEASGSDDNRRLGCQVRIELE